MASQLEREGVVRDEQTGELVIPASQRPDGSWRKPRRVKDGYIPQEEMPLFESKGTQFLKSMPKYPIGLAPEDGARHEQAKKAASDPTPAAPVQYTSKAAKKNAKRKEKKRQEQTSGNTASVSQVTGGVEQVSISEPKDSASGGQGEAKPDLVKKLKNLKKKLKQVEDLEAKMKSGELKNPEKDQLDKVARKQVLIDEIEDIELELEDS